MIDLMPIFSTSLIPFILIIVFTSLFLVFYFVIYLKEHRNTSTPLSDELETKSYHLLHQAQQKAQALLSKAELDSMKIASEGKFFTGKMTEEMGTSFSQAAAEAEEKFTQYLKDLQVRTEQSNLLMENLTKQRVEDLFAQFEKNLSSYFTASQQKSLVGIEQELKAVQQEIQDYKTRQISLVDENITAILEKAFSLVLNKRLSLEEHLELVQEALEKAKADKYI